MFKAHIRYKKDESWAAPLNFEDSADAAAFCLKAHMFAYEVRVTDENNFCIGRVVENILYVPMENGTFGRMDLLKDDWSNITEEQLRTELQDQRDT